MAKPTRKRCRILSRRNPTRIEYGNIGLPAAAVDLPLSAAGEDELPSPHDYPPYGGKCWRQAFDEATALRLLVNAAKTWNWAESYMGYLPKDQRNAIFAAYVAAKAAYSLAWQVMEDCLVGQTV